MSRLTPKTETIKFLLLRSGNGCAFPNCTKHLFNDDDKLIGECCHIEAAEWKCLIKCYNNLIIEMPQVRLRF